MPKILSAFRGVISVEGPFVFLMGAAIPCVSEALKGEGWDSSTWRCFQDMRQSSCMSASLLKGCAAHWGLREGLFRHWIRGERDSFL